MSVRPIERISLSEREFEFVQWAELGLTVPQIARVMDVANSTAYGISATLVRRLRRKCPRNTHWTKGWDGESLLESLWKDQEAERTYLLSIGSHKLTERRFRSVQARYERLVA